MISGPGKMLVFVFVFLEAFEVWNIALGCTPKGFSIVKRCDEDYNGNATLGDLFMVQCGSSSEGSGLGYYHVGVYCSEEEEEIIHFRLLSSQSSSSGSMDSCSSSSGQGGVSKVSVDVFCGKNKFAVYRNDNGIPASFREDVRDAMKKTPQYNVLKYNCIHFALELLKIDLEITEDYIKRLIKILRNKMTLEMEPMNV